MNTTEVSELIPPVLAAVNEAVADLPDSLKSTLTWEWKITPLKNGKVGITISANFKFGFEETAEVPEDAAEVLTSLGRTEWSSNFLEQVAESLKGEIAGILPKPNSSSDQVSIYPGRTRLNGRFALEVILAKGSDLHKEWLELQHAQRTLNAIRTVFAKELKNFSDKLALDDTPTNQLKLTGELVEGMLKTAKKAEKQLALATALDVPKKLETYYTNILKATGLAEAPGETEIPSVV